MALSPLAALSLPFATDPAWQQSASSFGERLRGHLQDMTSSDRFQQQWRQVQSPNSHLSPQAGSWMLLLLLLLCCFASTATTCHVDCEAHLQVARGNQSGPVQRC
jgi:hypothetical protein